MSSSSPTPNSEKPPADPPFSHRFFDKDPASTRARSQYLKMLVGGAVMIILLIWAGLSIYWGALWTGPAGVHRLHGWVVDFDNGPIGSAVTHAFEAATGAKTQISWRIVNASMFPNGQEDMIDAVVTNKAWAVVAINPSASTTLANAIASADAAYNGTGAVTMYYAEARNENANRNYVAPQVAGVMAMVAQKFAQQQLKTLASGNTLATVAAQAPQILTQPLYYVPYNTRPFNIPVATAVDFVGLIYLLIIAFFAVNANAGARKAAGLEQRLRYRSLLLVRIVVPFVEYFFLSLAYALVSKFFLVPFDRRYGSGGFVIYWMLSWVTMSALGFAVDSMLALMTEKFVAFFFLIWVITNISVSSYPPEIMPTIFRYGFAMPFYNMSQGIRNIVFGTKDSLGLNFGVQFSWIAVSMITFPFFLWIAHRRTMHTMDPRNDIDPREEMD